MSAGEEPVPIAITGDAAREMAGLLRHDLVPDDTITLRGLAELYRVNTQRRKV